MVEIYQDQRLIYIDIISRHSVKPLINMLCIRYTFDQMLCIRYYNCIFSFKIVIYTIDVMSSESSLSTKALE